MKWFFLVMALLSFSVCVADLFIGEYGWAVFNAFFIAYNLYFAWHYHKKQR